MVLQAHLLTLGISLKYVICWTDNDPNQYHLEENFYHIAASMEKLGIRFMHRFAVKENFKGSWDAAGKVFKNKIEKLEQQGIRNPTALSAFTKLFRKWL
jgi:hypothetical protein